MKKINKQKISIAIILICCSVYSFGQKNTFLSRDYWKSNPSVKEVKAEIKKGNDPVELNRFLIDAVVYAILENVNNKTIKFLLSKKGNSIDKVTHDGRTYVFWAAYKGNTELVAYLFKKGSDAKLVDEHGYNISNFAAIGGAADTKIYDLCTKYGVDMNSKTTNGANLILNALTSLPDVKLLDYFIDKGFPLESKDSEGRNAFVYASKGGNIALLDELLERGVKAQDEAVLFASRGRRGKQNSLDILTYLKGKNLKMDVVDSKGKNAFHNISWNKKNLALAKFFKSEGVNPNLADKEGNTPLMNATYAGLPMVKLLMTPKTDINQKNKKGESAFLRAVKFGDADLVSFLIENGAKIKDEDNSGKNAYYYLADGFSERNKKKFEDKLAMMNKLDIDVKKTMTNGNSLLHEAVSTKQMELIKMALNMGLDINTKNNQGITPLHKAAMISSNKEIMNYLIEKGADRTLKTKLGETVYQLAQENELLQKNKVNLSFLL